MTDSASRSPDRRRIQVRLGMAALGASLLVAAGWIALYSGPAPTRFGTVGEIPNRVAPGPDRDVPCVASSAGTMRCATPLPPLTDQDRAAARPLLVEGLRVPLDHVGRYRIPVGEAVLARGVIEVLSLTLANASDGSYTAPLFSLELQDAATGSALPRNMYGKGVVDGSQHVEVFLTFDLQAFAPGAALQVSRIEVR